MQDFTSIHPYFSYLCNMNYNRVKEWLATPKNIVITSHKNPDGDAIGSSLGMKHYLDALGHTCTVIFPTDFPPFLAWLPDADKIIVPSMKSKEHGVNYGKSIVAAAELIICLDFNDLQRIDALGVWIAKATAPKLLIDHHIEPKDFADEVLSEVSASSACELVHDFIVNLGDTDKLNERIITCLFTGIYTDTGCFSYATSPKLFRTAAQLQEAFPIDYTLLYNNVFNNDSEKRLRILGYALSQAMFVFEKYHTAVVMLTQNDYQTLDIQRGDTEGIVNNMLRMSNVKFAVLITDQKSVVRLSMRSKGSFNVQEFSSRNFGGGGHRNASGGESNEGLMATWVKFRKALDTAPDLQTDKW